ncbi:type IV pilus assembly protein PilM [Akkermansiaceae bacterium]|nr:type IV pilus assembly protein PilM [Akkermansiaceae bacterium]
MADTQTTVALNLGSQRISMAVFETSKSGGLILKGYESDTIIADPAFEASREAQIRVVIDDLIGKLQVPKAKVRYAVSGQAVFTRFVKLPPLQDDNIEQLVTFEAQQHVPFPISEVVWDYELIQGGEDKEVVIVAIKGDALDEINETVTGAGLSTVEVDVAPMALYNSFRETYGTPDEPTLIIDVGAKTSNLLYVEGPRFFTRSVAIGGASITAAIAKEYNISFPDAEHQKITNGLVALGGGHTETMDESLAALAMVIRNALTRLPAEIARTTNYYRSQHAGSAPRKVLLAGGGANLPYTLEFFSEKLGLPVEFFNPLGKVAIAKGVDTDTLQREAHTMGELIGLGLRGIGKSTINIDLVPSAVEVSRAADRRKPFLIAAAALFVAGFAGWAVFQNIAASAAEEKARMMLDTQEKLAPIESQIRGQLKTEGELSLVAKAYIGMESDHAFWFELLGELRGAFASDSVWLTEMSPLYDYNAIPPTGPNAPKPTARPIVKSDYVSSQSGGTAISDPPAPAEAANPRRNQQAAAPGANAILVKGFWRENDRSQNVVSDLLKKLRENSTTFAFSVKNPQGKMTPLSDEQILKSISSGANSEGDLAFPFELILPLSRQVTVR